MWDEDSGDHRPPEAVPYIPRAVAEALAQALKELRDEADYQARTDHPSPWRLAEAMDKASECLASYRSAYPLEHSPEADERRNSA